MTPSRMIAPERGTSSVSRTATLTANAATPASNTRPVSVIRRLLTLVPDVAHWRSAAEDLAERLSACVGFSNPVGDHRAGLNGPIVSVPEPSGFNPAPAHRQRRPEHVGELVALHGLTRPLDVPVTERQLAQPPADDDWSGTVVL